MPTPTSGPQADDAVTPVDGAALYDSIMGGIEPELLTGNLPNLGALMAADGPEERKARAARYAAAFTEYEKQFQERAAAWQTAFREFKRTAMHVVEEMVEEEEHNTLSSLETSMSTSLSTK